MADEVKQDTYSEPPYVTSKNDLKQKFYRQDISDMLMPATRSLLEHYSHVPVEAQVEHVHNIRSKAWATRPYPCIGLGVFLVPQLSRLPVYSELVQRLIEGELMIDVGCFIGHDMRHLVQAGVPSENLHGIDIVDFWKLGFEMFRDEGKFRAHFTHADFTGKDEKLVGFEGKFGVISVFQVLHQWDWAGQVEACKALVRFSKLGCVVVGNQIGNVTAREIKLESLPLPLWRHDGRSFERMWDEVGVATGTMWSRESWMRSFGEMGWDEEDAGWMEEGVRMLEFVVRRVR